MKNSLFDRYGVAFLLAFVLLQIALVMPHWHRDIAGFYLAAHHYALGHYDLVYAAPAHFFGGTPDAWLADLAPYRATFAEPDAFPFVYPPLWAALFAPMARAFSLTAFSDIIFIAQSLLFVAAVRLAWNLSGRPVPWPRWAAISTFIVAPSAAAATAFDLNQLQITLTFLTLLAFERLAGGKSAQSGLLLALVTAVKLTPALLAVIFILRRDWRALAWFAVGLVVLSAASLLVAGPDLSRAYLDQLRHASDNLILTVINFSAAPLLHLGFVARPELFGEVETYGYVAAAPAWIALASLGLLGVLTLIASVALPHVRTKPEIAAFLAALTIATAFAGPLGWAHYYLLPTLLFPLLLGAAPTRPRTAILIVLTICVSMALVKGLSLSPAPILAVLVPTAGYLVAFAAFLRPSRTIA